MGGTLSGLGRNRKSFGGSGGGGGGDIKVFSAAEVAMYEEEHEPSNEENKLSSSSMSLVSYGLAFSADNSFLISATSTLSFLISVSHSIKKANKQTSSLA